VAIATPPDPSHFFDYQGQSPLSADGRHLLAHRVSFEGHTSKFWIRPGLPRHGDFWRMLGAPRAFNWK